MDPFIRQSALETILQNAQDLKPNQIDQALKLGLTDKDYQISETAWKFVKKNNLVQKFRRELVGLATFLGKENDDFALEMAAEILHELSRTQTLEELNPGKKKFV